MREEERKRLKGLVRSLTGAMTGWRAEAERPTPGDRNTTPDYCQGRADAYRDVLAHLERVFPQEGKL